MSLLLLLSPKQSVGPAGSISRAGLAMQFDKTGKLTYCPNNLYINSGAGTNAPRTITTQAGVNYYIWIKTSVPVGPTSVTITASGTNTSTFRGSQAGTFTAFTATSGTLTLTPGINYGLISQVIVAAITYETAVRPGDNVVTSAAAYYGRRDDYYPNTLAYKGVLVEESRTNNVLYSNDPSNANWTKNFATVAQNAAGPDGLASSAWTMTATGTGAGGGFNQSTASGKVLSVFAKAGTASWVGLSDNSKWANFNVSTGTVGSTDGTSAATITPVGNGWYRITLSPASSSGGFMIVCMGDTDPGASMWTSAVNTPGHTVLVYGMQREGTIGSFATSYIPTTTATVTRAAETFSTTDAGTVSVKYIDEATGIENTVSYTNGSSITLQNAWVETAGPYTASTYAANDNETGAAAETLGVSNVIALTDAEAGTAADANSVIAVDSDGVAEAGSAAETEASTQTATATLAEAGAAADTPNIAATFAPSDAETGAATDSPSVIAVDADGVTETGSAADTETAANVMAASAAETGTAAETNTVAATMAPADAEAGAAAETETATQTIGATLAEAGTSADAPDATAAMAPADAETGAATDTSSAGFLATGSLAESGSAAETDSATATFAPADAETVTAADTPSAAATFAPADAETGAATDTPAATANLGASDSEAGSAADTPSAAQIINPTLSETGAAADTPSATTTVAASDAETGTAADTPGVTANLGISDAESGSATDTPSATSSLAATDAEAGTAADATTGTVASGNDRSLAETGSATDTVGATLIKANGGGDSGGVYQISARLARQQHEKKEKEKAEAERQEQAKDAEPKPVAAQKEPEAPKLPSFEEQWQLALAEQKAHIAAELEAEEAAWREKVEAERQARDARKRALDEKIAAREAETRRVEAERLAALDRAEREDIQTIETFRKRRIAKLAESRRLLDMMDETDLKSA